MIAIILSTGRSSRFAKHGFCRQKSMLPMPGGRTLLDWQVESLGHALQEGDTILYVTRKEYQSDELGEVARVFTRAAILHRVHTFVHYIEDETHGALDAIHHSRKIIRDLSLVSGEETLILYNDELVLPQDLLAFTEWSWLMAGDASVVSFEIDDERYTRVPNSPEMACGCTYWFKSYANLLASAASSPRREENGIPGAVYEQETWSNFLLKEDQYIELGTAPEYKAWMESLGYVMEWDYVE